MQIDTTSLILAIFVAGSIIVAYLFLSARLSKQRGSANLTSRIQSDDEYMSAEFHSDTVVIEEEEKVLEIADEPDVPEVAKVSVTTAPDAFMPTMVISRAPLPVVAVSPALDEDTFNVVAPPTCGVQNIPP